MQTRESVEYIRRSFRRVACCGYCVQPNLVGDRLLFRQRLTGLAEGFWIAPPIVEQLVVFCDDIAAVAEMVHSENQLHAAGHFDGGLMRHGMPQLVGKHAGQLVFVARERRHFLPHINPPAG